MGWLYLLTFPNGKLYVGQTVKTVAVRLRQHRYDAKQRPSAIYRAWRKYGEPTCTPIYEVPDDQLDAHECQLIAALRTQKPHGYNLTPGGDVHPLDHPDGHASLMRGLAKRTPEWRANVRAALIARNKSPEMLARHRIRGKRWRRRVIAQTFILGKQRRVQAVREPFVGPRRPPPNHRGMKRSPETRAKISAARMGMKFSESHKAALRIARKGQVRTPESKAKTAASLKAHHALHPETGRKIGDAHRGVVFTPERRARISAALMGKKVSATTKAKLSAIAKRQPRNGRYFASRGRQDGRPSQSE